MCLIWEVNPTQNQSVFFVVASKLQAWTSWWAGRHQHQDISKVCQGDWVRALVSCGIKATWLFKSCINVVCSGEWGCVHSSPVNLNPDQPVVRDQAGLLCSMYSDLLLAGLAERNRSSCIHLTKAGGARNSRESTLSSLGRSTPLDLEVQWS